MLTIQRTSSASIDRHIKALVCGEPGTGKTLIASTFPNPFYLTTEGLMMSLADRDIPFHKVKNQDELLFAVKMLQQPAHIRAQQFGFPVNTVVVDTIDDVSIMLLKERLKAEKHTHAELKDYGWLKDQMIEIVTALRNLDMNVVLTCHLKQTEVGGMTTFIPAIEGGFASKVAGYVDLAVVLQSRLTTKVVGHDTVRALDRFMQTFPDPQHRFLKDHSGKLPAEFPITFEDDYDRMATIIYGAPPAIDVAEVPEGEITDPPGGAPEAVSASATDAEPVAEDPDSLFAQPDPEPDPAPVAEATEPRFTCTSCSEAFDDEDQHDRCKIKGWPVLCASCSKARG